MIIWLVVFYHLHLGCFSLWNPAELKLTERTFSGKKQQGLKRKAEQPKCNNYRYMQNNSDQEREVKTEKVSAAWCCVKRKLWMLHLIICEDVEHTCDCSNPDHSSSSQRWKRLRSASPPTNYSPRFLFLSEICSPTCTADSLYLWCCSLSSQLISVVLKHEIWGILVVLTCEWKKVYPETDIAWICFQTCVTLLDRAA